MPTQPTAFDRLAQAVREMPEQKREDFAARYLLDIEIKSKVEPLLFEDLPAHETENDRLWDKTLHSPESEKFLAQMAEEADKELKTGNYYSLEEMLLKVNEMFRPVFSITYPPYVYNRC